MVEVTDRVRAFAVDSLDYRVQLLLDDPHGLGGDDDLRNEIATCRELALDLNMNIYDIMTKVGSEFEIKRLLEIETRLGTAAVTPTDP